MNTNLIFWLAPIACLAFGFFLKGELETGQAGSLHFARCVFCKNG